MQVLTDLSKKSIVIFLVALIIQMFFLGCGINNDKCCCSFEKESDVGCTKELFEGGKRISIWVIKCPKNAKTSLPEIKEIKKGFIKDKLVDIVSYRCDGAKIQAKNVRIINNNYGDGEIVWMRSDGSKFLRENYKYGKLHGKWLFYGNNGNIRIEQNFNVGEKVGAFKLYFEDGKIYQEGFFDEGSRAVGEWKTYDKNGKLIKTSKF